MRHILPNHSLHRLLTILARFKITTRESRNNISFDMALLQTELSTKGPISMQYFGADCQFSRNKAHTVLKEPRSSSISGADAQ